MSQVETMVEKFGESGRLFLAINKSVLTPSGEGILVQVFGKTVKVVLAKTPKRMTRFLASQITTDHTGE